MARAKRQAASAAARKHREVVAYHEAGHAVASVLLERRFRYVTIEPDEDSHGHVKTVRPPASFQPDADIGPRARATAEKMILCAFAGEAAAARWRGRRSWHALSSDFDLAADLAYYFCGDEEETRAYLKWLALRARNLVCYGIRWQQVNAVAKALLERKHLTYAEAVRVIQETTAKKLATRTRRIGNPNGRDTAARTK